MVFVRVWLRRDRGKGGHSVGSCELPVVFTVNGRGFVSYRWPVLVGAASAGGFICDG